MSFQSVLVARYRFADIAFNMFPASVAHVSETLSVLTNLDHALGVCLVAGFEPQG
jgi:hypothetical protein